MKERIHGPAAFVLRRGDGAGPVKTNDFGEVAQRLTRGYRISGGCCPAHLADELMDLIGRILSATNNARAARAEETQRIERERQAPHLRAEADRKAQHQAEADVDNEEAAKARAKRDRLIQKRKMELTTI